jgi:serine/threonine-protein kinase
MVMVYVPAGPFQMGSNDFKDSQPIHEVNLDTYWIDQTDVTNFMYAKCVQDGKCNQPSNTDHYNNSNYANHPVVYVSWNDAKAYCSWAGRRLPSEAEWEKAARGTDGGMYRIYPWGDSPANCSLANYNYCEGDTTAVDAHQDNASRYGAYDMAGNVWQWVNDWYAPDYYGILANNVFDPQGPFDGPDRVLRGGAWSSWESDIRATTRFHNPPSLAWDTIGFRCDQLAQSAP